MSDADDFMTRYLNNITSQYESSRFKPEYEPAEPETTKVTCRDGVELTVDIFRPATPGPYPTIVVRCPYPQQVELWKLHGEHLNRRGYAMVCEWCRGTYTSGGTWEPNVNERNDGADLLAWCEHQDWIDVIGLWGTSYLSLTCWTVADITTPKVASICANHYGTDRFASAYQKGSFRCDVLTAWAMQNAGYPVDADYMKSALHLPQMSVDEDMWGGRLDWYRDWISHPRAPTPTGVRDSGDCSSPSPPRSRCRCSSTRLVRPPPRQRPNRVRRAERAGQGTLLAAHRLLEPLLPQSAGRTGTEASRRRRSAGRARMVRPDPEAEADPHAAGRVLRDRQRFLACRRLLAAAVRSADEVRSISSPAN